MQLSFDKRPVKRIRNAFWLGTNEALEKQLPISRELYYFKDNLLLVLRYNNKPPIIGSFSCREELHDYEVYGNGLPPSLKIFRRYGLGFIVEPNSICGLCRIIDIVEDKLKLNMTNRTKAYIMQSSDKQYFEKDDNFLFLWFKPHPFWASSNIRFCFFTAMLKTIALLCDKHSDEDLIKAKPNQIIDLLATSKLYFKSTENATRRFLSGKTRCDKFNRDVILDYYFDYDDDDPCYRVHNWVEFFQKKNSYQQLKSPSKSEHRLFKPRKPREPGYTFAT